MTEHRQNKTNSNYTKRKIIDELPTTDHLHAADIPEIVIAPEATFVSILGVGAPGTDAFYRKMAFITDIGRILTYGANPPNASPVVEIIYWYPDDAIQVGIADFYSVNPISSLKYRMMVRINETTTKTDVEMARHSAMSASDTENEKLEIVTIPEQVVVQVMHHGPFANENDTLARLGALADHYGVRRSGPHHEIHLDPFNRSTPQDTLRTILRDPVS
ncbi:GyrI-like domain-containing protein [Niallia sp. JL1B1071]|uniref:GyrI-like domain-containing protein n=1 Tax=Niallia tiangongensis TaxID=3237105 RepID=UPI0037DD80C4